MKQNIVIRYFTEMNTREKIAAYFLGLYFIWSVFLTVDSIRSGGWALVIYMWYSIPLGIIFLLYLFGAFLRPQYKWLGLGLFLLINFYAYFLAWFFHNLPY